MRVKRILQILTILVIFVASLARAEEPIINERFPVDGREALSPPIVLPPIHECAQAVKVTSFVPKAQILVYANGSEVVGKANPKHGYDEIPLTRPLVEGDVITATQTVGAIPSAQSYDGVPVTPCPPLTTPVVVPDVYECGQVVPVANLVASTHIEVTDLDVPSPGLIGMGEATGDQEPIVTSKLVAKHHISAQQISCPGLPKTKKSPVSAPPLKVKAAPNPPPTLTMDVPVIGNDQVVLHHLLVGAEIQINYGSTAIFDGLANASDNTADVPPVPPGVPITAVQKLCTPSVGSAPVTATNKITDPKLGGPVCAGSHYVMVFNSTPNANVVLLRSGKVIGYAGGMLGPLKLPVGDGVNLADGDQITVVEYISSMFGTIFSNPSNQVTVGCVPSGNVVTQHNDNHRTGVYPSETTLTPASVLVRGMKIKYTHPIDGWINAQPLYVRRVEFSNGGANGLFIATIFTNKVYALDADTGAEKWVTTLMDSDPNKRGLAQGIDTTPVIDVPNHLIYVSFSTKNQAIDMADQPDSKHPKKDGKAHTYQDTDLKNLDTAFWVVALDYRTGKEVARNQVSASAYRADGTSVSFAAPFHRQHPALLLDHGVLYVAFGSIAGSEGFLEYHGWVMAYRASDLAFLGSFCTSRNYAPPHSPYIFNDPDDASGIWQGGGGLTADRDGNVYFLVGNGTADLDHDKYGDAFVKLTPTGSSLIPSAFIPSDAVEMAKYDADLGAGGTLTIPGTDFVIGGGKSGYMYLLDRNSMLLRQQITASTNSYDPLQRDGTWNMGPHLHGSPTYWRGPDPRFGNLYVWGEKDILRLYRFDTATGMIQEPAFQKGTVTALKRTMPGGVLSISSDGNRPGSGILWATLPATDTPSPNPGRLYAYNAETLQWLWDAGFPSMGHWLGPTIADGKVFVGTSSGQVICYELGEQNSAGSPYKPFELDIVDMGVHPLDGRPDESLMTTLPKNTLLKLAPPGSVNKYAVLDGEGTALYSAVVASNGKLSWALQGTSLQSAVTLYNQLVPEEQKVELSVSGDHKFTASDGSSADVRVVKTYLAPEDDGAPWELYEVTRTSQGGLLAGVRYIQRVFTQGGLPPTTPPKSRTDIARIPFEAQTILYRRHAP